MIHPDTKCILCSVLLHRQNILKTYIQHFQTMHQVYNITVSFGENIVKFKIFNRYLFRCDLFIEKVPEPKL